MHVILEDIDQNHLIPRKQDMQISKLSGLVQLHFVRVEVMVSIAFHDDIPIDQEICEPS